MFADLHLHTHFSDGTYSPAELVDQAQRQQLAAIALTDHDTVEGCEPTAEHCRAAGIEFITGTELTAEHQGRELHFLGYAVDTQNAVLRAEIAKFQAVRQNRVREMVARLNALRMPLQAEAVFALANCQSPGRPHVARALVEAGLVSNLDEAFERFLKKNRPAFVPKFKMDAAAAIRLIQQAGGVAVLAHPGLHQADDLIPSVAAEGLDGLECFHTKHSPAMAQRYLATAARHRLLVTGGSDCHGLSKGRPLIGTVRLPYSYVEALKARAAERRAAATSVSP